MSLSYKEELKLKSKFEMAIFGLEVVVKSGEQLIALYEANDLKGTSVQTMVDTAREALVKVKEFEL